ncbi:MAG: radical SAM protein [Myxococcales bacterium]|nr:radical SAM protein [Myxococcales bacterium]
MRVAFVSGNRELLPDAAIPIGILSVVANVPGRHEKTFIDLCFEDEPFEALAQRLLDFGPEVIALGMRNIQNADYSGTSNTLDYYAELIDTVRSVANTPIVIGGSGFSVMPAELMARLRPDYGISGEAEEAFPALLDCLDRDDLDRGASLDGIGNLHRFENGELVSNGPPSSFLDMNTLSPADRSLVDSRYYERFGIESLQTKRGCPLRCDYCTYPIIEGRVGRVREPSAVVDELFMILEQQPGTTHVFMVDSVFNLPKGHAKAVCREMIDRGVTIPWTCYANPLGFDAELAELMAEAGCAGMEVGADSGSNEILVRLRKGFTTDQIRNLHRLAEQAGIPDCHTFILGTPGETFDDVLRTLDFIVDLDPFSAILMCWVDDAEALDAETAREREKLRASILKLLEDHKSEFPWWSIPSLGVNYDPRLFDLLRSNGYDGPLWRHIRGLVPKRNVKRHNKPGGVN